MTTRAVSEAPSVPAWPALLTTDMACAYTSLSTDSFRFLARQRDVRPVDPAGLRVTLWRRADLDAMVDSLPVRGRKSDGDSEPEAPAQPVAPTALALERIRRRAR